MAQSRSLIHRFDNCSSGPREPGGPVAFPGVPSRWPVDYTQVFKKAEPFAYPYAFDDAATISCKGGCDYRVAFGLTPGERHRMIG